METIKILLDLRVKQFSRMLCSFATRCIALGVPFLKCGQPVDEKSDLPSAGGAGMELN